MVGKTVGFTEGMGRKAVKKQGLVVAKKVDKDVDVLEGVPKSGRFWKTKQTMRNSSQLRQGVLSHMQSSLEKRNQEKARRASMRAVEAQMKEEKAEERRKEREKKEEKAKRRAANEFRGTTYQQINPQKLKTMSKKQLRHVKKTRMAQNGTLELVGAYQ